MERNPRPHHGSSGQNRFQNLGKVLSRPPQTLLQKRPIKPRAWVGFAVGRNVLMPGNVLDGVLCRQGRAQAAQCLVLRSLKQTPINAFKLDANGVVIAVVTPSEVRSTRMPGARITVHELPKLPVALDVEMGRDFHSLEGLKIRVGVPIQGVAEKLLNFLPAVRLLCRAG